MKSRIIRIIVAIANDAGTANSYSLRPLPAAALGQSLAAFRLVNLTQPPHAVYSVRLDISGLAACDCPQHNRSGQCKHADALLAAGVLPSQLVALLQHRTKLLDEAEAMLKAAEAEAQRLAEAAMEERVIHAHDAEADRDRIADLTAELAAVADRAARLQLEVAAYHAAGPKRRRPAKVKAA